jgi:P27 family predicted phage terminase small subunit
LSPDAGQLWDEITATLPPGTLAAVDRAALTACCEWYGRWRDLDRRLQNGDGDEYKLLCLAAAASKQFATYAKQFGLTPLDRTKLPLAAAPEGEDPLAEFGVVS